MTKDREAAPTSRLRDEDIVTARTVGRRSALASIAGAALGSVALAAGARRAAASDPSDNDVTTVSDYKWAADGDDNTYADTKGDSYTDTSDLSDNDFNYSADAKSAADGDSRSVADAQDAD
jgi:hypothetical protein